MKLKYNVGRWGLGWTYFHLRYLQNHREFTQENYWNYHRVLPASRKLRIYCVHLSILYLKWQHLYWGINATGEREVGVIALVYFANQIVSITITFFLNSTSIQAICNIFTYHVLVIFQKGIGWRAWGNDSVGEIFAMPAWVPETGFLSFMSKLNTVACICNLKVDEVGQTDACGFLASQPKWMSLRVNEHSIKEGSRERLEKIPNVNLWSPCLHAWVLQHLH